MAEGRSKAEWGRLSHLLSLLANVNRNPRKPPFAPSQFNPHAARRRRRPSVEQLTREILAVGRARGVVSTSPGPSPGPAPTT